MASETKLEESIPQSRLGEGKKPLLGADTRVIACQSPQIIVKVFAYTPICKPLNGTLPRSNNSHFLRLAPSKYQYMNDKKVKEGSAELFYPKGIRGIVRHASMKLCHQLGLEICHSSDKKVDKHNKPVIPPGFHALGECANDSGSCLIHQVYGGKGQKSIMAVYVDPITCPKHETAQLGVPAQKVRMGHENRVSLGHDGKTIQNFGERYFSGDFTFELDVTKCTEVQLGLIIHSVMRLDRLGCGFTAGYGHLEVREFELVKRSTTVRPQWTGKRFKVIKEVEEEPLYQDVQDAMEAFTRYVPHS